MALRKERVHHTGSSNLITTSAKKKPQPTHLASVNEIKNFFNADEERSPDTHQLVKLQSDKSKSVHDLIYEKSIRSATLPMDSPSGEGKHMFKTPKAKLAMLTPKAVELEELKKLKHQFTFSENENEKIHLEQALSVPRKVSEPNQEEINDRRSKKAEHAKAIQETQLVGFDKYGASTFQDNVNLEKVREARRVLRRKYGNRKNMHKIYNTWDEEHTGHVSTENIYSMSKKLGLNLNMDEARVLLASANRSSSGVLNIDEFLDLIYNKDDLLNVNIHSLNASKKRDNIIHKEDLEDEDNNVIKKLQDDAKKTREYKRLNQLTLVLKNRIVDLSSIFREVDSDKIGYVNDAKFEEALQKLGISKTVINPQDITNLFNKHKEDNHRFNWKTFLNNLEEFEFKFDDLYTDQKLTNSKKNTVIIKNEAAEKDESKELTVVDCRNLPYNTMWSYYAKSKKIGHELQKLFPNKESLSEYFSKHLKVEKKQMNEKFISTDQFKETISDIFKKFDIINVQNKDLEGFLSCILYNKHGYTNFKEVAHTIYDETEKQFMDKVQMRKKGPEPHIEARYVKSENLNSENPSTPLKKNSSQAEIKSDSAEKAEPASDEKRSPSLSRVSLPAISTSLSPTKNLKGFIHSQKEGAKLDDGLKQALKGIDDKYLVGTKAMFKVFKEFDTDGDGYVSHKDFVAKVEEKLLVKKEHIPDLLNYLDPENKGYVNFNEFSKKIRPNMAYDDEEGNRRERKGATGLDISKPDFDKSTKAIAWNKQFIDEITKTFAPTPNNVKAATRSGAKPAWKNTFLGIQADSHSPMFVSEEERFYRSPLASTMYQAQEKAKLAKIQEGRINVRKFNQTQLLEKIEKETQVNEMKEQRRLMAKQEVTNAYDNNLKQKSIFSG